MSPVPVITVDGPSGAGKGTISHMLADTLGWHFLDSGALYRVVGQACLMEGVSWDDHRAVARIARHLDVSFRTAPSGEVLVACKGIDVSREIRTEEGGRGASTVAVIPEVREALLVSESETGGELSPRMRLRAHELRTEAAGLDRHVYNRLFGRNPGTKDLSWGASIRVVRGGYLG